MEREKRNVVNERDTYELVKGVSPRDGQVKQQKKGISGIGAGLELCARE